MTGSHEVVGSIPISSTIKFKDLSLSGLSPFFYNASLRIMAITFPIIVHIHLDLKRYSYGSADAMPALANRLVTQFNPWRRVRPFPTG